MMESSSVAAAAALFRLSSVALGDSMITGLKDSFEIEGIWNTQGGLGHAPEPCPVDLTTD